MALLSLQGVTLNLGGKTLLDTVDLHVEQGERVCLVGRNGVGKSSLMALLSGDLTPDGGTIVRTPGVTFGHMPQAVPDHWSGPVFGVVASGLGKEGEALAAAHLIATGREDQLSAAKLALARDLLQSGEGWERHGDILEAINQLGLDPEKPLVVSVWGSLGASYMNEIMTAFITRAAVTGAPFSLIHSAGRNGYEKMHTALLEKCPADLAAHGMDVRPYIYDMPLVMDAADLVLCRAGASTLAELTCIGKPAVLIPSPNVTNNHQERNARVLERAGGAKVLLEGSFTADDLYNLVSDLLADPAQLAQMADNMRAAGVSDAAERIADLVLELADRHTK